MDAKIDRRVARGFNSHNSPCHFALCTKHGMLVAPPESLCNWDGTLRGYNCNLKGSDQPLTPPKPIFGKPKMLKPGGHSWVVLTATRYAHSIEVEGASPFLTIALRGKCFTKSKMRYNSAVTFTRLGYESSLANHLRGVTRR
jgi:hypothetical protein